MFESSRAPVPGSIWSKRLPGSLWVLGILPNVLFRYMMLPGDSTGFAQSNWEPSVSSRFTTSWVGTFCPQKVGRTFHWKVFTITGGTTKRFYNLRSLIVPPSSLNPSEVGLHPCPRAHKIPLDLDWIRSNPMFPVTCGVFL